VRRRPSLSLPPARKPCRFAHFCSVGAVRDETQEMECALPQKRPSFRIVTRRMGRARAIPISETVPPPTPHGDCHPVADEESCGGPLRALQCNEVPKVLKPSYELARRRTEEVR
jgi:hypothetical protein